jgi:hypothetical protein
MPNMMYYPDWLPAEYRTLPKDTFKNETTQSQDQVGVTLAALPCRLILPGAETNE